MTAEAYWIHRTRLNPERAAALLGAPLAELSTPKAIGLRWAQAGLGVQGHAAKDVLLDRLKLAEEDFNFNLDDNPEEQAESDLSDLDKALRTNGVPGNVDWDVYSADGEGGRYHRNIWLVGRPSGGKTYGIARVVWRNEQSTASGKEEWDVIYRSGPLKGDAIKVLNAAIGQIDARAKPSPSKWGVWPDLKLTEMSFKKMSKKTPASGLRDCLISSGFVKEPANRKVIPNIELVFKKNPVKRKWDKVLGIEPESEQVEIPHSRYGQPPYGQPPYGQPPTYKQVQKEVVWDIDVRVSGKEYALEPETLASRTFQKFLDGLKIYPGNGHTVNVTKLRGKGRESPAFLLNLLLDSLTGEPSGCILGITKALEWFEDRDKQPGKTASAAESFRRMVAQVSSIDFAEAMGMPLDAVLAIEANHV